MKTIYLFLFTLLLCPDIYPQSKLVSLDNEGNLIYTADANNFIIPDFSHAGYQGGGIDIPQIEVVKEISPISGDNTAHIQAAIDEVGSKPLNSNGVRGALLLKAGTYTVNGTINVKYSGIVLRGEGNGTTPQNSTIIYAKGNTPSQRDVIVLGNTSQNKWTSKVSGTQTNITDDLVKVGSTSFSVENISSYKVGDLIAIYHPCTDKWLQAVNYGGVPAPSSGEADERWVADQLPIIYHRYITKIEGKTINIDAPVFYTLNKSLSQSYIYKFKSESILEEIGIENLRVDIESLGGEDENHAWQAIRFRSVENCWAKNVVASGFGQSGFITDCCTRTTIEDCQAVDPVSIITGERRYNFNTYLNSQLILFKDCYARNGRHHYVSNGTSSASGNVFLNCVSDATNSVNEGHRQWTQGMLYDNHKEINLQRSFVLGLYNRVDMGTGHGWAAVQSVLWNCDVTSSGIIGLQQPPTSQNYAIGCTAKTITGNPVSSTNFTIGYIELQNKPVSEIQSLYLAQLKQRMGMVGITNNAKPIEKPYQLKRDSGNLLICFSDDIVDKKVKIFNPLGQILYSSDKVSTNPLSIGISEYSGWMALYLNIAQDIYTEKLIY